MIELYKIKNGITINTNLFLTFISNKLKINITAHTQISNKLTLYFNGNANYIETKKLLLDNIPFFRTLRLKKYGNLKTMEITFSDEEIIFI